jgi:hypothetical protein
VQDDEPRFGVKRGGLNQQGEREADHDAGCHHVVGAGGDPGAATRAPPSVKPDRTSAAMNDQRSEDMAFASVPPNA